jgi:hypothetical protein
MGHKSVQVGCTLLVVARPPQVEGGARGLEPL